MGKPLLTDEMIERAKRGEKIYDEDDHYSYLMDKEETKIISTDHYHSSYNDDYYANHYADSNNYDDERDNYSHQSYYDEEEDYNYNASSGYQEPELRKKDSWLVRLIRRRREPKKIYKSRRIENAKRSRFQHKLNMVMLVIFLLLALLFFAVFKL